MLCLYCQLQFLGSALGKEPLWSRLPLLDPALRKRAPAGPLPPCIGCPPNWQGFPLLNPGPIWPRKGPHVVASCQVDVVSLWEKTQEEFQLNCTWGVPKGM
jgi:hypothetical protein